MELAELIKTFAFAAVVLWLAFKVLKWVSIVIGSILYVNVYMLMNHPIWFLICFGFWLAPAQPIMSLIAGEITLLIAFGYKWDKPRMLKAMGIGAIIGLWLAKRKHEKLRIKE
ncbi:hypothetical protein [Pseudidiomarina sp.]|uniref:hypothetical protein n=1 Tax=Pseudidiomarina sp. TaxID=2081707 RepID=UPI003A97A686